MPCLPRRKPVISSPDSPKSAKPNLHHEKSAKPAQNFGAQIDRHQSVVAKPNQSHQQSIKPQFFQHGTAKIEEVHQNFSSYQSTVIKPHQQSNNNKNNVPPISFESQQTLTRVGSEMRSSTRCGSRSSALSNLGSRTAHYRFIE